jgi:hypothetical protein
MAALKGNVGDLKNFGKRLNAFPTTLVHAVAEKTAPALTQEATSAYSSGRSVYGEGYGNSKVTGERLTLKRTGVTGSSIRFVATGTVVRCVLGPRYARYLIGNYRILPMGRMPVEWAQRIREIVANSGVKP